jgi:hypothetical protein
LRLSNGERRGYFFSLFPQFSPFGANSTSGNFRKFLKGAKEKGKKERRKEIT